MGRSFETVTIVYSGEVEHRDSSGGGGTIGWTYLSQHARDAHYLAIGSPALLTNHITGKSVLSHLDFTPLAMLASEYTAFAVAENSPIKNAF